MTKMESLLYHWRSGLKFLTREGIEIDQAECYKHMLEQTTKWSKNNESK